MHPGGQKDVQYRSYASVRQNLLSLQSTADLLATTQSRLSTGKKVNSALDNPTNYFTAASLDSRASDINKPAGWHRQRRAGACRLPTPASPRCRKLIDSAKSVANQALQSAVSYSQKSSVTSAIIPGATANNLLGPNGASTDAAATPGSVINNAPEYAGRDHRCDNPGRRR